MNRVVITISIQSDNHEAQATIDSMFGGATTFAGKMYPTDVDLVNEIVKILRVKKDKYHAKFNQGEEANENQVG